MNRSVAGVQREWWVHRDGCGLWFRIERDTRINAQVGGPFHDGLGEGEL
jgi:sarcosine oxidase subunit delta